MPDLETGDYQGSLPEPSVAAAGEFVGPYKLRMRLGQGGMGEVWVAEQTQPVHRQVAIKLIKSGMSSAKTIARFGIERQALALMDHPNIARVFDAGSTPAGKPYFVMELVKGVPITQFCDREKLTPRERLELFIPVCQAVQHAHQKGIIHRDLKPSNILVGQSDGKPVPKVIDFGVAKSMGFRLTEDSLDTEIGTILGTYEYMAPEQASIDNLDIDTRADVYSLGVILYELLAGSPPFSRKKILGMAIDELLRMIRVVEPVKPSTKLSSAEDLPSLAAVRRSEPRRLTNLLKGDLDWIAMKCLEKERARRYESASGLALDLRRYLDDEPVLAGPPSKLYLLKKFIHRHRGPVAASALLLLALIAGTVGTGWGMFNAERARKAEVIARQKADENADLATANLDAAFRSTTKLVELSERVLPGMQGSASMRRDLLHASAETARLIAAQRPESPEARRRSAHFYRHIANIHRLLDDTPAAEQSYRAALAQLRNDGDNREYLAETLRDYGVLLARTGRLREATTHYEEASAIGERLHAADPANSSHRRSLATAGIERSINEGALGQYDAAIASADLAIGRLRELTSATPSNTFDHLLLPAAMMAKAVAERDRSGYAAAQPTIKAARELIRTAVERRSFGAYSDDANYVQATIEYEASRTWVLNQKQDLKATAETNLGSVVKQFIDLSRRHPDVPQYRGWLGKALLARGEIRAARGNAAEATTDYDDALRRLDPLVRDCPTIPEYRADLGRTLLGLARLAPADTALHRKGVDALQAAALTAPDDAGIKTSLTQAKTVP